MDTRRDFIYVDDLVDVVDARRSTAAGERGPYHVSSGADYSIKELFDATVEALGIELDEEVEVRPRSPDDAFTILLDPSKTERDFDWAATTPLEDGRRRRRSTYYREHGIAETYTHLQALDEQPCREPV